MPRYNENMENPQPALEPMKDLVSLFMAASILVIFAVVGLWDIYVVFAAPDVKTVSFIVYHWGQEFPPMVLAIGLLLGHLFWPVGVNGPKP